MTKELEKIFEKVHNQLGPTMGKKHAQKRIQKKKYALQDIVNFVQEKLDDPTQKAHAGSTLSTLINTKITEHDKITLKLESKKRMLRIDGIGSHLPAGELTVIGDVGRFAGAYQTGGRLIIKGNTGNYLCEIKKGAKTIIEKNAGSNACEQMGGGTTWVLGNAGDYIGSTMRGGMLITKGKIGYITSSWKAGIIIEKNEIRKINMKGWDINTITPLDKHLPKTLTEEILVAYTHETRQKDWRALVEKPENHTQCEHRAKLRKLDQELPLTIRKIGEPEEKLAALKALEREALKTPTKEVIALAQICGANPDDAVRKYNQELEERIKEQKEKLKRHKEKIRRIQKEKL